MYIEKVPNRTSPPAYLLRIAERKGKKVVKRTLANLSHLPLTQIEAIRAALKGGVVTDPRKTWGIVRSLPHGNAAAVLGTIRKLGLDRLIAREHSRERDIVVGLIAQRLLHADSKAACVRGLREETQTSTLASLLGIGDIALHEAYDALDWLVVRQESIEKRLAKKHMAKGDLALWDLTSVAIEGSKCPIAAYGYSRDHRRDLPQIEFGVSCTKEGCPFSAQVFQGNTADPTTFTAQTLYVRTTLGIEHIVAVGDRGMITSARIDEDLRPEKLDWITSLRAPDIQKLCEEKIVQTSMFDRTDLVEVASADFPDERLIVCRNERLAAERVRKREALLLAAGKRLQKIQTAVAREKRPLHGKEKIGLRVGKALAATKMEKHFLLTIEEKSFSFTRNPESIRRESYTDGLYAVRTSLSQEIITADDAVETYKNLSTVERAFRSLKSIDLAVGPVRHYAEPRVRAHVFLCMLAYYVEWHMRRSLAPVLYQDHDPNGAKAKRTSVVAPAQRSNSAKEKEQTHRQENGKPVHSFRTLLEDLGTITKNFCKFSTLQDVVVEKVTQPTALQAQILSLLDVSL